MTDYRILDVDNTQRKIPGIWLSDCVAPRHVVTLLLSAVMVLGVINLLNLIQHPTKAGSGEHSGARN